MPAPGPAPTLYDSLGNAYALSVDNSVTPPQLSIVPIAGPPPPLPVPPPAPPLGGGGWMAPQIISQVMGRTENRAMGKPGFDPRVEFWLGLDEFCQEKHYYWRRKTFSFQTTPGVQSYDLSSNGTSQANAGDLAEIEEIFCVNAPPTQFPGSVHPQFTARDQIAAIYGSSTQLELIPNNGYFLIPGEFQQLNFMSPPNSTYTVAGTYYAVPMVTDMATTDIPLVPPNLHFGLFDVLERRILKYLYGQNDPRYLASQDAYMKFLEAAAKTKNFSQQYAMHMKSSQPAVVASGGRGWAWGGRR